MRVHRQAEFELTQAGADVVNALLPTCQYVVGIRENETGEVRFCPQHTKWIDSSDKGAGTLWWWAKGNMGCDCNRELEFCRAGGEEIDDDDLRCGEARFTVVGIWFPGGDSNRDLWIMNDF